MSMALMEYGRYFFHHTRWKTAAEHIIIPSGKLRLSPYSQTRDALEAMAPMLGAGVK